MCLMRNTMKVAAQLVITLVGTLMFCGSLLLAAAPGTATATAVAAPVAQHAIVNPEAKLDTAQITDLRDNAETDAATEGQDVLPLSWHAAPAPLWNALGEQHPEWYDDDVAGLGTYWVPVGTVIDVPGGLALATIDGWAGCQDWTTFDGECSATGPVEMLDIEPVPATVIYGAGAGALCGTDDQCAMLDADRELAGLPVLDGPAYGTEDTAAQDTAQVLNVAHTTRTGERPNHWCYRDKVCVEVGIPAEDGTRVPLDYYAHRRGPSKATCDYLGKRLVPDAVYGTRCAR